MDDEEDPVPEYFEYDLRSFAVAKAAVSNMKEECKVLEYLTESKPKFLLPANSMLGVDTQQLDKYMAGISDKLTIHGYPDRGERLRYLYHILSQKYAEQGDLLKTVMRFLMEIGERPTSLLRLDLNECLYSELPDDEIPEEDRSARDKALLKEILGDDIIPKISTRPVSYSSESDLSDWSSEEESEGSQKSQNELPPLPRTGVKTSQSFSDFSKITFPKDEATKQKELEDYWNDGSVKARAVWKPRVYSSVTQLRHQPVITGLFTFQTKFGEYWEWKHAAGHKSLRFVISEEVVLREILWQFSTLRPESSQVFSEDWELKPGLMTTSLSHSSFQAVLAPLKKVLASLHKMKIFVSRVYSLNASAPNQCSSPKILIAYAQSLSDYMHMISAAVEQLERGIVESVKVNHVSTLLQLVQRLDKYTKCVQILDELHCSIFQTLHELSLESMGNDPGSCLLLLSKLCKTLDAQTDPQKFGVVLYIFSNCLHALLEEINSSFALNWSQHLLFERFPDINISNPNFWTGCIKRKEYERITHDSDICSIEAFNNLISGAIVILKTSEMLRQLNEDGIRIIGSPPDSRQVVDEFLEMMFSTRQPTNVEDTTDGVQIPLDYDMYFKFLGLQDSAEADSISSILGFYSKYMVPNNSINDKVKDWKWLLQLTDLSTLNPWDALAIVLKKSYSSLYTSAKNCIRKVFIENDIESSLKVFREIILETREDFAKAVIAIAGTNASSSRYKWEDQYARNPAFQKLLTSCYPEGRENFEIKLKMERSPSNSYTLFVTAHFPLNLILLEDSIASYVFVSRQLSRVRKSLWEVSSLSMKDSQCIEGVELYRVLLFRFCLLNFCSSLRAYIVFKIFGRDFNFLSEDTSYNLDEIQHVHQRHLKGIEIEILRNALIDKVILKKVDEMTTTLRKFWVKGIPRRGIVLLEDTLKKCWNAISIYSKDSNDCNSN